MPNLTPNEFHLYDENQKPPTREDLQRWLEVNRIIKSDQKTDKTVSSGFRKHEFIESNDLLANLPFKSNKLSISYGI